MPNLRLTDQEAADIASYLLLDKTTAFDSTPVPNVNEPILDEIASDFLSQLNDSQKKPTIHEN